MFHSRGGVRNDELTPDRVRGALCPKHPELNGLRVRDYRLLKPGPCVGCTRDRLRKTWRDRKAKEGPKKRRAACSRSTLHFGVDEKYGDTWEWLHVAMVTIGFIANGYRRTTQ